MAPEGWWCIMASLIVIGQESLENGGVWVLGGAVGRGVIILRVVEIIAGKLVGHDVFKIDG
jgi:hypothetical protein